MKILFSVSGIKKSAYYKWLSGIQNRLKRDHENQQIIEAIKELYDINKGTYGVDRMTHELIRKKGII